MAREEARAGLTLISPTLVIAAPAGDGPHELALLQLADDGTASEVTAVTVTVIGTR